MTLGPKRCGQDALCGCTDLQDSLLGVIERTLQALAEAEVAVQEMVGVKISN